MIRSMTGYGRHQAVVDGLDITAEIKSVNHRYFEFSIRTSRGYSFAEDKIKSYIQSRVSRGKIDMYVSIVSANELESEVTLNQSLAAGYISALKSAAETYNLRDDITASVLSNYSDIFTIRKAVKDEDRVCAAILEVVSQAADKFVEMREAEGQSLKTDVMQRADTILRYVGEVEKQSPKTQEDYINRLRERITDLIGDVKVDEQRLLTEVAIFADKIAVAEETVRLRSHFDQLSSMITSDAPVGRKLDFLLQEMNRETNTIGSKAQDSVIAHTVIEMKAELEKIREQIQNIE
ncbi:MAG: YicC family protein [Oscillospiraceae bacterium]|jgi:uncharacterized protein (TIGR00255 family)|nr:YicC family protein [Oscillospiraceae bacterium]